MRYKLFLFLMLLPVQAAIVGCTEPAQDEAPAPEDVERAIGEAQEQGNQARAAGKEAARK